MPSSEASTPHQEIQELIEQMNPDWKDLAEDL